MEAGEAVYASPHRGDAYRNSQKPSNLILLGQKREDVREGGQGRCKIALAAAGGRKEKVRGYPELRQESWPLSCPSRFSACSSA